jgi:hypothetical protein
MASLITSCSKWHQRYDGFVGHDQKYYSKIATDCDILLSRPNSTSNWWILSGNDKSLPIALQELKSTTIKVAKHIPTDMGSYTGVLIIFGEGRGGYVVSWTQKNVVHGTGSWQVAARAETQDNGVVLFSR